MKITDEAVDIAARAMAILDEYDGCFLELDSWNALEDWEREAHPESEPDEEECNYWRKIARAGLEAASGHLPA
jgi:hypothetical protein